MGARRFRVSIEEKHEKALSLLPIEGRDLETEAAVVAVHRHDGAVVEVSDQPARHLAPALLHQVTSLGEEVLPLPGRRHQPRLTERRTEETLLSHREKMQATGFQRQ